MILHVISYHPKGSRSPLLVEYQDKRDAEKAASILHRGKYLGKETAAMRSLREARK